MEFRILGPLEVVSDGQSLGLGGAKQRCLLAVLLLNANTAVSNERLIDAMWEEDPPDSALKALQVHVSGLRKVLGKDRLLTKGSGYLLRVEEDEFDVALFEHLHDEGSAGDALSLWRGQPLSDFGSRRFAQPEIARLEDLRLACLEQRIGQDLEAGRHSELTGELEGLVKEHPLRERLRAQLMLALYRSGRQADALAVYQEGRYVLVDELGIEPGRELRELQQTILRQDPALDLGDLPAPAADEPIGRRLQTLSGECRRVLSLASVLGEQFGLVALERVADYTGIDRLLQVLAEAIEAGIVEQVADSLGWLRFCDPRARETLYLEIPGPHRARLHRRVAEVLESLYAVDPERHRAEVAHHRALAEQG